MATSPLPLTLHLHITLVCPCRKPELRIRVMCLLSPEHDRQLSPGGAPSRRCSCLQLPRGLVTHPGISRQGRLAEERKPVQWSYMEPDEPNLEGPILFSEPEGHSRAFQRHSRAVLGGAVPQIHRFPMKGQGRRAVLTQHCAAALSILTLKFFIIIIIFFLLAANTGIHCKYIAVQKEANFSLRKSRSLH